MVDISKTDLINLVATSVNFPKASVEQVVNEVLAVITRELAAKKKVVLVNFGTFKASERAARTGRDPRTGAPINIPAATVPKFTAGKGLKDALNGK